MGWEEELSVESSIARVSFEQRPKGGEGVSHVDSLEKSIPEEGTACTKLSFMALFDINLNVEIYMKFSNSFWGNKKYFPVVYLKLI